MKKLLSFVIIVGLLMGIGAPARAQSDVGLFTAFTNLARLESYASLQTMTGALRFQEGERTGNVKFKLSFKSNINNVAAFKSNSATDFSGHLNVTMEGPDKPFDTLTINFKTDLVFLFEKGFYVRLKEVNFETAGVPEDQQAEALQSQEALKTQLAPILNEWFFVPLENLTGLSKAQPGLEGFLSQEELLKELQKGKLEETYRNLAHQSIQARTDAKLMTKEDAALSNELIDMILTAKFLRTKTITQGNNKGFQVFALDKRLVSRLAHELTEKQGETLSDQDARELEMILTQIGFSGIYRVNPDYDIYDNFLVRFRLREIEAVKAFELSYRSRVSQINSAPEVTAPASYKTLEESGLAIPFIGQPEEEDMDFEEDLDAIEEETSN